MERHVYNRVPSLDEYMRNVIESMVDDWLQKHEPGSVEWSDAQMVRTWLQNYNGTFYGALEAQPAMPQPKWANAPEWAQWWAVDPTGFAMWYEEEPLLYQTVTFCGWGAKVIYGLEQGMKAGDKEIEIPFGIDWRQTRQRRPGQEGA